MSRRIFIKQLLAMGLMTPSLNTAALSLITSLPEKNNAVPASEMMQIIECEGQDAVIKVFGVGGAGCNALNMMLDHGGRGVEFIAIDSDVQSLKHSKAQTNLQIVTMNASSEADRVQITRLINDADIVFIVAGMGGETSTSVVSLVGEIARSLNILTIAVVTSPAGSERIRVSYVTEGLKALRENVDSLIVVPIDDLMRIHNVAMPAAFKIANGMMQDAVAAIAEFINVPGMFGVEFAWVDTVMSQKGSAMVGSAIASGPDRGRVAAERAIASPVFANMNLSDALGVLVTVISNSSVKLEELDDVMGCVQLASDHATVIVGAPFDESMVDEIRVTIVATGMGLPERAYGEWRA